MCHITWPARPQEKIADMKKFQFLNSKVLRKILMHISLLHYCMDINLQQPNEIIVKDCLMMFEF